MDKKGLGSRIRSARKSRGLTGEKLADACNINAVYLRQIEAGVKIPSLPMFVTICRELKASPSYLLADSVVLDEESKAGKLEELLSKAEPDKAKIVIAMIQAALNELEN